MLPVWTHASKSYSRSEKQWWIYEEVRWSGITFGFKQTPTTAIAKNSEIKSCCLKQQTIRSSNVRERERTLDKGHKAWSQVKYQGFWEDRAWMSTGREREGSAECTLRLCPASWQPVWKGSSSEQATAEEARLFLRLWDLDSMTALWCAALLQIWQKTVHCYGSLA